MIISLRVVPPVFTYQEKRSQNKSASHKAKLPRFTCPWAECHWLGPYAQVIHCNKLGMKLSLTFEGDHPMAFLTGVAWQGHILVGEALGNQELYDANSEHEYIFRWQECHLPYEGRRKVLQLSARFDLMVPRRAKPLRGRG